MENVQDKINALLKNNYSKAEFDKDLDIKDVAKSWSNKGYFVKVIENELFVKLDIRRSRI
jgi:hypothetical protein